MKSNIWVNPIHMPSQMIYSKTVWIDNALADDVHPLCSNQRNLLKLRRWSTPFCKKTYKFSTGQEQFYTVCLIEFSQWIGTSS